MKIAIIGPGAMGLLFGSYLSKKNDVTMIGRNVEKMAEINFNGVVVKELDGSSNSYHLKASTTAREEDTFDLILIFTKASATRDALLQHKNMIGKNTLLLTLQNGMGHEMILKEFAAEDKILIGTTKEGSYVIDNTSICHSGVGATSFGTIAGDCGDFEYVANTFTECGLECSVNAQIKKMIWDKIMINASSSVLSGVFQVPQGFVIQSEYVWNIAKKLIAELCETATADGYPFDCEEQINRIYNHLKAAPDGYTSIYADLKAGRKTEVSVINGAVVEIANRLGISVPTHELIVDMVHGLEDKLCTLPLYFSK